MSFDSGIATLIASFLASSLGITAIIFSWLRSNFENIHKWLDAHEAQDQRRHEENLYRFEKISVALAKLGSSNGTIP